MIFHHVLVSSSANTNINQPLFGVALLGLARLGSVEICSSKRATSSAFLPCTIENLQKSMACHRAAFDFDMGFILQSVKLVAGLDLEQEVENGPPKKKRGRKKNLT